MKRLKRIGIGTLLVLAVLAGVLYWIYGGGEHQGPGSIHKARLADSERELRQRRMFEQTAAARKAGHSGSQVLFGDLHVHSTFSTDAFARSLPFLNGEGAHPPADACDFARFCSQLDFFAMTDHAEGLTRRHWQETIDTMRQCDAVAGDSANPDLVPFMGFEWSQVGRTPEEHYGHKNVIFQGLNDADLPARPIGAAGLAATALGKDSLGPPLLTMLGIPLREFSQRRIYLDFAVYQRELKAIRDCATGVDTRALPKDCRELAATPKELFTKLDQWGLKSLVIPHGSTWGFYTPPGYSYDKQLKEGMRDPNRQRLIEIYSGHGNSEEYRSWTHITSTDPPACPEPTADFEPCCYRAGEIIRSRCGDASSDECEKRVQTARQNYAEAGSAAHNTVPGATLEEWRGCGICRDCFNPAFQSRPRASVQYILARGNFDDPARPYSERFGIIGSSDNHTARPGTGYKEFARHKMGDAAGPKSEEWRDRMFGAPQQVSTTSQPMRMEDVDKTPPYRLVHLERQASFFMTGGLVAVHATGRSRPDVWKALQRKEVYGTSGDRILLWFDLLNGPEGRAPMGSEVALGEAPKFRVRAVGAFAQKPGCPDSINGELTADELATLCLGECYNPSDTRRRITRIEVVRIRPQIADNEPIESLISDPWKTLPCQGDGACVVEFEDPELVSSGRTAVYYVRAIQEPTDAVNAGGLRCKNEDCSVLEPCRGDWRTPYDDDCLSSNEERAWSSPIFVDYAAPPAAPGGDR